MSCRTSNKDFLVLINKVRDFTMKQQALSQALSEAKQLGTCKIFTSVNEQSVFRSLDSMLKSGSTIINKDITRLNDDLKEMSS